MGAAGISIVCPESGEVEFSSRGGRGPLYPQHLLWAERNMSDAWNYGFQEPDVFYHARDEVHQASRLN